MSTNNHTQSRKVAFAKRGQLPQTKIITTDNHQVLLTKENLKDVSNMISAKLGRKLSAEEIPILHSFIRSIPPERFFKRTIKDSQSFIVQEFITRNQKKTGNINLPENYQQQELYQLTHNENQLKFTTFADRRGNAVIDRNRTEGNYSAPNNVPPYRKKKGGASGGVSSDDLKRESMRTNKMIQNFLDPPSIDEMFKGLRQSWTTFQTITLPHQTVPLDSRNRLLTHTTTGEYKWNLHSAGQPGRLGDLQLQDTLSEIIRMKICPFWIPVNDVMDDYYAKIRLLIREFSSSSTQVTEFLTPDETTPTTEHFHFEFEIDRRDKDRVYLIPVCDTYTFTKPFARPETITTHFRAPYDPIDLDADRVVCVVSAASPAVFTSTVPHNVSTGDLVYVIKYGSASASLNQEVNRSKGYFATKLDNFNFTLPVDTTSAGGVVQNVTVMLGSKRIIINIEFTSLEQE